MRLKTILILPLLLAFAYIPCLQAASIKLSCGREVRTGQQFMIKVTAQGVNGNISLSRDIPGCAMLGVQESSSYTSVTSDSRGNARVVSYKEIQILARAERPGHYRFGPVSAGGVKSNVVEYTVSGSSAGAASQTPVSQSFNGPVENDDVFIRASVSDKSPYIQQGVIYDLTLYTRVNISRFPDVNLPKFDNCTFEQLPENTRHNMGEAVVNGKTYKTFRLYSFVVYPSKSGTTTLKGSTATIPLSVFDELPVKINDVQLNVRDLPGMDTNKDVNGVGEYNVSMNVLTKQFRTGEAGKVSFTVKGMGNPAFVSMPTDFASLLPDGFKLIKTESNISKTVITGGVDATITLDCYILPSKTGDFEIPSVTFTFFNTKTGEWYTRKTKAVKLNVAQGSQTSGADEDENLTLDSELQETGELSADYSFYLGNVVYWLLYILPVVAMLISLALYRRHLALLSDPDKLKLRRANSVARRRLREAANAMKRNDKDLFYDETLKALWGYLSDKLGIPTSDLSRQNISAELSKIGVSPEVAKETIEFIDDCEFAKYGSSADMDMQSVYDKASRLIDSLENEINKVDNPTQNR